MQNKCNCGCQSAGFVPVSGNWDFNTSGDCGCQQGYTRRANRRSSCQQCSGCDNDYVREGDWQSGYDCQSGSDRQSGSDCQCERCNDSRTVECCDQNTYIRDMDDREYSRSRSGSSCGDDCECENCTRSRSRNRSGECCDECESAYSRSRSGSSCGDDCECENCTRSRSRNRSGEGCDECESAYRRSGNDGRDCGCNDNAAYTRTHSRSGSGRDNGSTYARSGKNRGVGMIKAAMQEIDEIFESESALRAGTIFPELHKPLNGYCPYDGNCGTCAQAAAFAAWELRLYLNTHPNDEEALKLFRKLCKEAEDTNYATTFLEDDCCTSGWSWVKNPWPWEYDCRSGSDCQCGD